VVPVVADAAVAGAAPVVDAAAPLHSTRPLLLASVKTTEEDVKRAGKRRKSATASDPPDRDPRKRNVATGAGRATSTTTSRRAAGAPTQQETDAEDVIHLRFTVPPMCDGWRLDHYLKHRISRLSRTRIQGLVGEQIQFEDGRRVRASTRVRCGETIHLRRPAPLEPDAPRTFDLLQEDPDFYVIDKPAGLPIHTTARFWRNTLTAVLRERFPEERLQVCHRLDKETSGVLLIARTPEAASQLKQAFAKRQTKKTYLCLVRGVPNPLCGEIDVALKLLDTQTGVMMGASADGLPSRTRYRVLSSHGTHAFVEALPETGRQHQIRVHLAHLGHPILGDKLYGASEELFMRYCDEGLNDELLGAFDGLPRQSLHAHALTFPHPKTREPITVKSPWPAQIDPVTAQWRDAC